MDRLTFDTMQTLVQRHCKGYLMLCLPMLQDCQHGKYDHYSVDAFIKHCKKITEDHEANTLPHKLV